MLYRVGIAVSFQCIKALLSRNHAKKSFRWHYCADNYCNKR